MDEIKPRGLEQHCPICNRIGQVEFSLFNDIICESFFSCSENHYSEQYLYGHTWVTIGDKDFKYSYETPQEEMSEIQGKIDEEIVKLKRNNDAD